MKPAITKLGTKLDDRLEEERKRLMEEARRYRERMAENRVSYQKWIKQQKEEIERRKDELKTLDK